MKTFCKDLREPATKIINCEKLPLTQEEKKSHSKQEFCYICKKELINNDENKYCKVRDHCHYTVNIETFHIVSGT